MQSKTNQTYFNVMSPKFFTLFKNETNIVYVFILILFAYILIFCIGLDVLENLLISTLYLNYVLFLNYSSKKNIIVYFLLIRFCFLSKEISLHVLSLFYFPFKYSFKFQVW